tara:strand:+ start:625 stop:771 length:147 start_codon:yes stop_codon:yes gene_type:complete
LEKIKNADVAIVFLCSKSLPPFNYIILEQILLKGHTYLAPFLTLGEIL